MQFLIKKGEYRMKKIQEKREECDESAVPIGFKKPFDPDQNTPEEILFNCGKYGLPPENAVGILRRSSDAEIRKVATVISVALQDPDSLESCSYSDGVVAGKAELAAALHQSVIDADKDAYKSYSAENRRKAINRSIQKNFGVDEGE